MYKVLDQRVMSQLDLDSLASYQCIKPLDISTTKKGVKAAGICNRLLGPFKGLFNGLCRNEERASSGKKFIGLKKVYSRNLHARPDLEFRNMIMSKCIERLGVTCV